MPVNRSKCLSHGNRLFPGGEEIQRRDELRLHFPARDDGVNEAAIEEKFGGLKTRRQFSLRHILDDTRPVNPIIAPGSARIKSPTLA